METNNQITRDEARKIIPMLEAFREDGGRFHSEYYSANGHP